MFQVDLPVLCETEAFCIRAASYTLDIDVNNQTFSYHSVVQCLAESDVDSWSLRYEKNVVGYSRLVELTLYDKMNRECQKSHDRLTVRAEERGEA